MLFSSSFFLPKYECVFVIIFPYSSTFFPETTPVLSLSDLSTAETFMDPFRHRGVTLMSPSALSVRDFSQLLQDYHPKLTGS